MFENSWAVELYVAKSESGKKSGYRVFIIDLEADRILSVVTTTREREELMDCVLETLLSCIYEKYRPVAIWTDESHFFQDRAFQEFLAKIVIHHRTYGNMATARGKIERLVMDYERHFNESS